MTLVELAARLIRVFEGVRLTAYRDSGGVLTIGFGHTGPDVLPGMTITFERAVELFRTDCAPLLLLCAPVPVLEGAALVSFGYNCGVGSLKRVLTAHDIEVEAGGFKTRDGKFYGVRDRLGNVQPGLESRRLLEASLVLLSRLQAA